ncbi:MAG TPA: hypothetical protein VM187_04865 [Niastella sp.]|nr:hypothetical protein [Niastella sp.]
MKLKSLLSISVLVFLFSCAVGIKRMNNLSLGMTKEQIKTNVGDNYIIRGAVVNDYNQSVEVWEYEVRKRRSITTTEHYWLYLVDSKLVQWGRAGDWSTEAARIKTFQFPAAQQ